MLSSVWLLLFVCAECVWPCASGALPLRLGRPPFRLCSFCALDALLCALVGFPVYWLVLPGCPPCLVACSRRLRPFFGCVLAPGAFLHRLRTFPFIYFRGGHGAYTLRRCSGALHGSAGSNISCEGSTSCVHHFCTLPSGVRLCVRSPARSKSRASEKKVTTPWKQRE